MRQSGSGAALAPCPQACAPLAPPFLPPLLRVPTPELIFLQGCSLENEDAFSTPTATSQTAAVAAELLRSWQALCAATPQPRRGMSKNTNETHPSASRERCATDSPASSLPPAAARGYGGGRNPEERGDARGGPVEADAQPPQGDVAAAEGGGAKGGSSASEEKMTVARLSHSVARCSAFFLSRRCTPRRRDDVDSRGRSNADLANLPILCAARLVIPSSEKTHLRVDGARHESAASQTLPSPSPTGASASPPASCPTRTAAPNPSAPNLLAFSASASGFVLDVLHCRLDALFATADATAMASADAVNKPLKEANTASAACAAARRGGDPVTPKQYRLERRYCLGASLLSRALANCFYRPLRMQGLRLRRQTAPQGGGCGGCGGWAGEAQAAGRPGGRGRGDAAPPEAPASLALGDEAPSLEEQTQAAAWRRPHGDREGGGTVAGEPRFCYYVRGLHNLRLPQWRQATAVLGSALAHAAETAANWGGVRDVRGGLRSGDGVCRRQAACHRCGEGDEEARRALGGEAEKEDATGEREDAHRGRVDEATGGAEDVSEAQRGAHEAKSPESRATADSLRFLLVLEWAAADERARLGDRDNRRLPRPMGRHARQRMKLLEEVETWARSANAAFHPTVIVSLVFEVGASRDSTAEDSRKREDGVLAASADAVLEGEGDNAPYREPNIPGSPEKGDSLLVRLPRGSDAGVSRQTMLFVCGRDFLPCPPATHAAPTITSASAASPSVGLLGGPLRDFAQQVEELVYLPLLLRSRLASPPASGDATEKSLAPVPAQEQELLRECEALLRDTRGFLPPPPRLLLHSCGRSRRANPLVGATAEARIGAASPGSSLRHPSAPGHQAPAASSHASPVGAPLACPKAAGASPHLSPQALLQLVAEKYAASIQTFLIPVSAVASPYVGQTEEKLRRLLQTAARASPSVLVLLGIDQLARKRGRKEPKAAPGAGAGSDGEGARGGVSLLKGHAAADGLRTGGAGGRADGGGGTRGSKESLRDDGGRESPAVSASGEQRRARGGGGDRGGGGRSSAFQRRLLASLLVSLDEIEDARRRQEQRARDEDEGEDAAGDWGRGRGGATCAEPARVHAAGWLELRDRPAQSHASRGRADTHAGMAIIGVAAGPPCALDEAIVRAGRLDNWLAWPA
ncbi:hypothetical protein BESB_073460 [Besnoitia besnoiti]|uniref:ATPase AAA-type core domain-containing protein n=1 Tax=Besnoitia besnoiti TaxID=94643 RepID=A0A2A9MAG9_BESBE|nr:uncharacterized protein BESB_073460 [Besnoitia besnoiti]PFH34194.1 hypothetical protein BESB_073460 [Besnoitia besnoiti]